ncbi:MAG: SARP family transcriptional regulator, partial [Actinomycetota bacterium]|nr:SARP family transcriptional regulator [Actinomycetota bacterium]
MEIALLGTFGLRVGGQAVDGLAEGSQRLLVFLALRDRPVDRVAIAGAMWPQVTEQKSRASLRSALSRLDTTTHQAIMETSAGMSLAGSVAVDFRDSQALAKRLLRPDSPPAESDLGPVALAALSDELLPDWYDEWVLTEAEDWRQLRLNALEAMARLLTAGGRLPGAAGAARAAMKVEPLRESAHASLIRV